MKSFVLSNQLSYKDYSVEAKDVALRYSLLNYYETYSVFKDGSFFEYLHDPPVGIRHVEIRSSEFFLKYIASITFLHLYIEHFVFNILENIHPILAKGTLNKELDIISFLTGDFDQNNLSAKKRINYSIALQRIALLIKCNEQIPERFRVPPQYHFILKHLSSIEECAVLRNEVVHSGENALYRYAYELFFTNKALPLVREFLNVTIDKDYFLERNLHCGLNVIDELIKTQLTEDYQNKEQFIETKKKLERINHLKELGRASWHNELGMREDPLMDHAAIEQFHNIKIRQYHEALAQLKVKELGHFKISTCPCCGIHSLTTYQDVNSSKVYAKCSQCTYSLGSHLDEPSSFGIQCDCLWRL